MGELSVYCSFLISEIVMKLKLVKYIKNSNMPILNRDMKIEESIYKCVFLIVMSIQAIITITLVML